MRGEEWDRLVMVPTATEMDAALAGVRVRALEVVRRDARRRSVRGLLLLVLAGAGGLVAGQRLVPVSADDAPGLMEADIVSWNSPAETGSTQRYHITTWAELDGVRMSEGQAWVEGEGRVRVHLKRGTDAGSVQLTLLPRLTGDSAIMTVRASVSWYREMEHGRSRHFTERLPSRAWTLRSGRALLIYPFGRDGSGEHPVTVVRIEGPFAGPAPATASWQALDSTNWGIRRYAPRVAAINSGALDIRPIYQFDSVRLRVTLDGFAVTEPVVLIRGRSTRLTIPGLERPLHMRLEDETTGDAPCFSIRQEPRQGWAVNSGGCFSPLRPDLPVRIYSRNHPMLLVQLAR